MLLACFVSCCLALIRWLQYLLVAYQNPESLFAGPSLGFYLSQLVVEHWLALTATDIATSMLVIGTSGRLMQSVDHGLDNVVTTIIAD